MDAQTLLERFKTTLALSHNCEEIYCSTCGGKASAIIQHQAEYEELLKYVLSTLNLDDLFLLRAFLPVIAQLKPTDIRASIRRILSNTPPENISVFEKLALLVRKQGLWKLCSDSYQQCLKELELHVMSSENISVLETLVVCLDKDILGKPNLVTLALKHKNDPRLTRALYNTLRNDLPEVRHYKGGMEHRSPQLSV